ncbi:LOW QUALITY PROTEIN: V-set and immunoglobulin domain-containing protein 4-like [Alligator sinensis]|uniref:LOW QUALITY PROTEIN: V-set and immunoglobulin domain-containing protein 4-like n=1 Tax=Alligator sinensis TaxID=38654 RepID=UPI000D71F3F3|nr:LOW QUALITY PROTEIN: V-set and immunoglobulin domain-containing protein 4-like [Alligator sinensis]
MEKVAGAVVLVNSFLLCNAILDLTGTHEIEGVWKSSTILPCIYVPSDHFNQTTVVWTMERDHTHVTVIQRDLTGDHTLLTRYRDRVSIQKEIPGNVSLQIKNLEIPDSGRYTCKVALTAQDDSLTTKEVTTTLRVVKVAVSKPIITPGHLGLTVMEGARASLTCSARGSPPISYQWFKGEPGGSAVHLSNRAELVFDPVQSSDVGKYYCEAENRARSRVSEQSDVVQLTVKDLKETMTTSPSIETTAHAATIPDYEQDLKEPRTTSPWIETMAHSTTIPNLEENEDFKDTMTTSPRTENMAHSTTTPDLEEDEDLTTMFDYYGMLEESERSNMTIDLTTTVLDPNSGLGDSGRNSTATGAHRTSLSLSLVILIAVLCASVVFLVITIVSCRQKNSHKSTIAGSDDGFQGNKTQDPNNCMLSL